MVRIKYMMKSILTFLLVVISLLGLGGCNSSSSNDSSEITRYGVSVTNLSHGLVEESKISEGGDLSQVRISSGRPTAFKSYYLVFRFKVTSLEELKEDNSLYAHIEIDNMTNKIAKGQLIQTFNNGEKTITQLYRSEDDVLNGATRINLPKNENDYVNVTIAWKFVSMENQLRYKIYFDSYQLNIDSKSVSKTLKTKLAVLDKPKISFDEETNTISWDSIENCHYYNVYVNGELYMVDDYEWLSNPTKEEKQYLNLKDIGIYGEVKIKIRCFAWANLANPVYSNTVTCNISE